MQDVDVLNYKAIQLLETLGNAAPSQQQIDVMEQLLARIPNDRILHV